MLSIIDGPVFMTSYFVVCRYAAVQCPELPISHQTRSTEKRHFDVTVTYTCDIGYTYFDNSVFRSITCLSTGRWSDIVDPCSRK